MGLQGQVVGLWKIQQGKVKKNITNTKHNCRNARDTKRGLQHYSNTSTNIEYIHVIKTKNKNKNSFSLAWVLYSIMGSRQLSCRVFCTLFFLSLGFCTVSCFFCLCCFCAISQLQIKQKQIKNKSKKKLKNSLHGICILPCLGRYSNSFKKP